MDRQKNSQIDAKLQSYNIDLNALVEQEYMHIY